MCIGGRHERGGALGVQAEQAGIVAATGTGRGADRQLRDGHEHSFVAQPDVEAADAGQATHLG